MKIGKNGERHRKGKDKRPKHRKKRQGRGDRKDNRPRRGREKRVIGIQKRDRPNIERRVKRRRHMKGRHVKRGKNVNGERKRRGIDQKSRKKGKYTYSRLKSFNKEFKKPIIKSYPIKKKINRDQLGPTKSIKSLIEYI